LQNYPYKKILHTLFIFLIKKMIH